MPPALFPAIAILAGAVAGTFLELPSQPALAALPLLCAVAVTAWSRRFELLTVVCTSIAFCLSAAVLAADARGRALHPPLRSVLDEAFGGFAIDALGPEQDHDPMLTRAVLREDAAARDDDVSLRVDVIAVQVGSRWRAAEGGVSLTVSGPAAANRARDWRAGRVIEAPATFRRAARYLKDGVPDGERQLALDGTRRLGSGKSAVRDAASVRDGFDRLTAHGGGGVQRVRPARLPKSIVTLMRRLV